MHDIRVELSDLSFPWIYFFPRPISYANTIIYNCFQRVAWSLSLCWIIFACSKGYGGKNQFRDIHQSCLMLVSQNQYLMLFYQIFILGIVNDFLSWGVFAPLSRLTFFMYLIHIDLESIFFYSMDYTFTFTDLQFVRI